MQEPDFISEAKYTSLGPCPTLTRYAVALCTMFHPLHEDLVELQSGPCLVFDLSMSSAFGFAHYLELLHINITTLP